MARCHRAAALAMVISVFALLFAAGGSASGATTLVSAPAASVMSTSDITVVIRNFAYLPANFTVSPGATVTVRNEDQEVHTLTADNLAFNTGNVARGIPETFQAPTQPGRYPFHCWHRPFMSGVLTVS